MIRFVDMRQIDAGDAATPDRFDMAFVGQEIDDRGQASLNLASNSAARSVRVVYDPETFHIHLDGEAYRASNFQRLRERFAARSVLLDATSLDPVEMIVLTKAFLGNEADHRRVGFVYAEPLRYTPQASSAGMEYAYAFAQRYRGLKSLPGFAHELRSDQPGRLVACLGFESERLDRIIQDDDSNFIRHVTLVFGVPPYRATWEMHALLPHERLISQHPSCELEFAGANNPKAAYECLKAAHRAVSANERLIVAPLGSKPSSIGMALFTSCRDDIRLSYDFPVRLAGQTQGVGSLHHYVVERA